MSPKPVPPQNVSEFESALERARQGHAAEAVQHVERILERASTREPLVTPAALALAGIARIAERSQDLVGAERALELAVAMRPHFPDLQHQLACVLIARNRRFEARRVLEKALALNPGYVAARVDMAMLDARDGMIGEALAALRMLATLGPIGDPRAFSQGMKRLEHAEWDEADALIRRGLHLSNAELSGRIERFHAHMREEQPERAAEVLREVLPGHESYPDLHYLLGTAELRLGHADDALASLASALELNPDYHLARVQFALALDACGMAAAALDQMSLVLQHEPDQREAAAFVRAHEGRGSRTGTQY